MIAMAAMMAAMMLPAAAPAAVQRARTGDGACALLRFVGSYLAVWALFGAAMDMVYRPPALPVAGAIVIAAGLYELSPLKRSFRRRCTAHDASGFAFALSCAGSCIGLMIAQAVLGMMSLVWMSAAAAVILVQKLLPANRAIDLPLSLAMIALGAAIIIAPAAIPAITQPLLFAGFPLCR